MPWRQVACDTEKHQEKTDGHLYWGNSAEIDLSAYNGRVQCVYMDPPFLTGDQFNFRQRIGEAGWTTGEPQVVFRAYSDKYTREEYMALLRVALTQAKDLLKDTGSLFLHLDSRMGAYARILCDEIFGEKNFVNEIIWSYQSGGRSTKHFSRKHDVILYYRKSRNVFFDITKVPVSRAENRQNHMKRHKDENGRSCRTIRSNGKLYTYYDDDPAYPGDVWSDVSHLQQKDPQRTGYDTQKPQALLERIIRSTTREGDLVADLFCGSGTSVATAALLKRQYLGVDLSRHAISVSRKRLLGSGLQVHMPCDASGAAIDAEIMPGIGLYDIRLKDYSREGLPEGVNGLDAVDQWSVGFIENGCFRAYVSEARRKQTPRLEQMLQLTQLHGTPALLIVDAAGARSCWAWEE